ncbi:hypothetical protein [Actinopolymorpha pittospori]|uniref:Uncharacterized protein n=1 Tax=Actinopolymorpha pittospori TaxID=648752 RepID=A0A927MUY1_9ACTN|nr:hypothetical protein [Actinopolymorpha pittospori]MBE1603775.1 hypothetical protein [Actinopolymorpha pittospori]
MSDRDEALKAARNTIEATVQVAEIKLPEQDQERAAQLLVDLWAALHMHGIYDDSLRDVVNVSKLAIYAILAARRTEATLAAIVDGPYNPPMTRTTRHLRIPEGATR